MSDSFLVEQLGRNQTVRDVEMAYRAIVEHHRQVAVHLKRARQEREKRDAEAETFFDDLRTITGLPYESPLFRRIASLTIARRLARRAAADRQGDDVPMDDFPDSW